MLKYELAGANKFGNFNNIWRVLNKILRRLISVKFWDSETRIFSRIVKNPFNLKRFFNLSSLLQSIDIFKMVLHMSLLVTPQGFVNTVKINFKIIFILNNVFYEKIFIKKSSSQRWH